MTDDVREGIRGLLNAAPATASAAELAITLRRPERDGARGYGS
ncbi:hypothetical protein [Actinoplanes sp. TFC3]|nr:hypothetical protein [Actinoplanes sp. TFC3]